MRYFNGDSARSLGVEVNADQAHDALAQRLGEPGGLPRSTGTNSDADEAYLQAVYDEAYTPIATIGGLTRSPLLWDKPWTVSVNIDFSVFRRIGRGCSAGACRPTGAPTCC